MNLLTKIKHKAEYNHYKNLSILYGQNKSKTWKLINDIAHRKRKAGPSIKSLRDSNGVLLEDPKQIADCLNNHFTSIGQKMADKINDRNLSNIDPLSYITHDVNNSMFLRFTSTYEISERISKLDNKKSSGYDLISNCILKATNRTISPYLKILFNQCINQGIFPGVFK